MRDLNVPVGVRTAEAMHEHDRRLAIASHNVMNERHLLTPEIIGIELRASGALRKSANTARCRPSLSLLAISGLLVHAAGIALHPRVPAAKGNQRKKSRS
jgi:hypothetical protein